MKYLSLLLVLAIVSAEAVITEYPITPETSVVNQKNDRIRIDSTVTVDATNP